MRSRARIAGLFALALSHCGGGDSNLQKFAGAPWSTTATGYTYCKAATAGAVDTLVIGVDGSELTSAGSSACTFRYSVTGDVARLSNAPVVCSGVLDGLNASLLYTRAVLTTSDGHHLSGEFAGTYSDPTVGTCPFEFTIVGTR